MDGKSWTTYLDAAHSIAPAPEAALTAEPSGAGFVCKALRGTDSTPHCVFGDKTANTGFTMIGDSHAEQYLPAFEDIAAENTWRIDTYFHSACPFSFSRPTDDVRMKGDCVGANRDVLAEVLADPSPRVIVVSGSAATQWVDQAPDPETGLRQVWEPLLAAGHTIIAIRDNPHSGTKLSAQNCVARQLRSAEDCGRPSAGAFDQDPQVSLGEKLGVEVIDLSAKYCTESFCPAVIGGVMVNRDDHHLSIEYAQTLADDFSPALKRAIARLEQDS